MQSKASRQALKLALIYIIAAGGWILLSDEFSRMLVRDPDARTWISIYMGWAFVLVTGGLLHLTVRRLLRNWEREAEQRREIMEKLRESDELYRQLFELESDALVLVDAETHCFVEVNRSAQQLYGYSRKDFLQMRAEDISAEPEKTRETVDTGSVFVPLRWHRKKNGERFAVEITASVIQHQGRRMVLTAIRDTTARRQAMDELREAATQLLEAQRIANLGSYVLDVATERWTCSQVMDELFGIADAGFTKDFAGWLEIVHPDDRAELWHYWNEQVLKRKVGFDRTYRIVRRNDRQERTVHGLGKLILDDAGRVVKMVGIIQDITERKHAERRIVEATNYAQTLLAASPIGIITYQADGQAVSANAAAARLVGTTLENVKNQNFRKLESWKKSKLLERAELALATGQEQTFEDHTVSSYGNALWLLARFVPFRYEGNSHLLLLMQDISERRRAEEQVQVQFSALTAAANAIVITDGDGKIEWVNPAFTKLTGYSAEEVIGGNSRMLKSGRHSPGFYANLWATIITGNVWHGEMINKRKDGRLYTEETTITPVRGADGKFAHFVAIKQDVTERRGLELRLQQAQKMEAIGTLAGGIAHDFNNILAAIFGYGYLLKQDTLEKPAQEYVGEILKAAHRGKELVQQILTFSRQREFDRQIIQLQIVVKEAMKLLRASMPASIKIETNFAPDAPAVLADPTQIYQVVTNLATNALHAMEDRPGRLTVSLEPFQPDEAFIRLHPEIKPIPYARLTVADTGHGIDAGTLKRIFEPFFTTKPVGKGTGLGLSVVHGILQAHEGAITVESEVGRGTAFALYFPGTTKGATVAEAGAKNAPGGRGQKILLLDDEPALTAVLQSLLARLNYQATTSNGARNAIGLCRENPARFDLVITDLTMPEMNGLEVARQIRAIRPDMPVILISGFSVELSREDLTAAGICESLKKPIGMNQLAEAVQEALINNDRCLPPARQPS